MAIIIASTCGRRIRTTLTGINQAVGTNSTLINIFDYRHLGSDISLFTLLHFIDIYLITIQTKNWKSP